MANLVAIAYDDVGTAQRVMGSVSELVKQHALALDDAVVIERKQDGKVKLHQPSVAGVGAAGGALWGGLIGLLFLNPLLGMAIGAGTGAAVGAMADYGVDDNFMKELGTRLERETQRCSSSSARQPGIRWCRRSRSSAAT